jgi:hypothetical protein
MRDSYNCSHNCVMLYFINNHTLITILLSCDNWVIGVLRVTWAKPSENSNCRSILDHLECFFPKILLIALSEDSVD